MDFQTNSENCSCVWKNIATIRDGCHTHELDSAQSRNEKAQLDSATLATPHKSYHFFNKSQIADIARS